MAIILNWLNYKTNPTYTLQDLKIGDLQRILGVYIIWNIDGKVVRLGQGVISDRLSDHRRDPKITRHGLLHVTWARVAPNDLDGVEAYLADVYGPLVGERFPDVTPIPVNLPE